jgi:hypothetical protein
MAEYEPHVYAASVEPHSVGLCRGCGRSIVWGLTNRGRKAPFDNPESPDGYVNHWVTCPNPPIRKKVRA